MREVLLLVGFCVVFFAGCSPQKAASSVPAEETALMEEASRQETVQKEVSGALNITEVQQSEWMEQILSRITWEYDEEYDSVKVSVDGEYAGATLFLSRFLQENHCTFQNLSFGDIAEWICHDGQQYLWVQGGISVEERETPQYTCGIDVLVPVDHSADGKSVSGEIKLTVRNYASEEDVQDAIPERVVNVMYEDVTHDGVEDRIVTSITCAMLCGYPTAEDMQEHIDKDSGLAPAQMLGQGETCYVRVYDGNSMETSYDEGQYAVTGGYDTQQAIWEKALSNSHAGNGQVFLLEQDGLACLVEASDYFGQGMASYSYAAFSPDEKGRIFIKKENSYFFDTNEGALMQRPEDAYNEDKMKAYEADFKSVLDSSVLIAATDWTKEPRISTQENICTYDIEELRSNSAEVKSLFPL